MYDMTHPYVWWSVILVLIDTCRCRLSVSTCHRAWRVCHDSFIRGMTASCMTWVMHIWLNSLYTCTHTDADRATLAVSFASLSASVCVYVYNELCHIRMTHVIHEWVIYLCVCTTYDDSLSASVCVHVYNDLCHTCQIYFESISIAADFWGLQCVAWLNHIWHDSFIHDSTHYICLERQMHIGIVWQHIDIQTSITL